MRYGNRTRRDRASNDTFDDGDGLTRREVLRVGGAAAVVSVGGVAVGGAAASEDGDAIEGGYGASGYGQTEYGATA
jgi:hypothetical protein